MAPRRHLTFVPRCFHGSQDIEFTAFISDLSMLVQKPARDGAPRSARSSPCLRRVANLTHLSTLTVGPFSATAATSIDARSIRIDPVSLPRHMSDMNILINYLSAIRSNFFVVTGGLHFSENRYGVTSLFSHTALGRSSTWRENRLKRLTKAA